jgi:hypothetical protein
MEPPQDLGKTLSDFHNYIASDMQISIMRLQEEVERLKVDRDYWRKMAEETNTMNNEPENVEEEKTEQTFAQSVAESVQFIVDMMNSGKVNPKDVYPEGRYHGD